MADGGIGILDVAHRAGVSAATVSRALRGLPNVSRATRTKVLAAADELGYAASPLASALATGRMRSVGVVVPQAGRWFFAEVLRGIEAALRRHGYDLVLHVLADDDRRAEFFGSLPVRRRVDALLLVALDVTDAEVAVLHGLGLPLAWIGERVDGVHGELVDDAEAAQLAVRHLVELGHRRIASIGGPLDGSQASAPAVRRTAGFRSALGEAGVTVPAGWVRDGGFTPEGARAAAADLLAAPPTQRPTALFCQSDEMAFGALAALRALGLRCPDDVSVVGIDGHELAATFDLTTVTQPAQDLGAHAARWLVARLADDGPDDGTDADEDEDQGTEGMQGTGRSAGAGGGSDDAARVHPVRLVVRGSTAPPAAPPPRREPVRQGGRAGHPGQTGQTGQTVGSGSPSG